MGFEEAQTDVIVICDDDSKWGSNALISLVTPLLEDTGFGCVFPDLRVDLVGEILPSGSFLRYCKLLVTALTFIRPGKSTEVSFAITAVQLRIKGRFCETPISATPSLMML